MKSIKLSRINLKNCLLKVIAGSFFGFLVWLSFVPYKGILRVSLESQISAKLQNNYFPEFNFINIIWPDFYKGLPNNKVLSIDKTSDIFKYNEFNNIGWWINNYKLYYKDSDTGKDVSINLIEKNKSVFLKDFTLTVYGGSYTELYIVLNEYYDYLIGKLSIKLSRDFTHNELAELEKQAHQIKVNLEKNNKLINIVEAKLKLIDSFHFSKGPTEAIIINYKDPIEKSSLPLNIKSSIMRGELIDLKVNESEYLKSKKNIEESITSFNKLNSLFNKLEYDNNTDEVIKKINHIIDEQLASIRPPNLYYNKISQLKLDIGKLSNKGNYAIYINSKFDVLILIQIYCILTVFILSLFMGYLRKNINLNGSQNS